MFSSRIPTNREPNRIARALTLANASGRPLIDLTVTNPTAVGIDYPDDVLQPLVSPQALHYVPQPFGLESARCAVARDYSRRGIAVAQDRVVLTASTSEAYSLLFKLLCHPHGDDVLVPVPSYPLFEHLTGLDGVMARSYSLEYHGRWMLDRDSVDLAWTAGVRAVLAVSPNNPTGSVLSSDELAHLSDRCAARDAALIVDEVFADYPLGDAIQPTVPDTSLTFRLGGLSKSVGLPQIKLAWIAVSGPAALVDEALSRLELIADTYLSVSTPVQVAAPVLLEAGSVIRSRILRRVRENHALLSDRVRRFASLEILHADAGWSAVVRVPARMTEEDLVVKLIEEDGVAVHPGFFFDFANEAYLVISLLPEPSQFAEGVRRILERAGG